MATGRGSALTLTCPHCHTKTGSMHGSCPSCGRGLTADADETLPGTAATAVSDIGGLDDATGPGLEQVTGFASETATDVYSAGAGFAATARAHGNAGHAHAADD